MAFSGYEEDARRRRVAGAGQAEQDWAEGHMELGREATSDDYCEGYRAAWDRLCHENGLREGSQPA